MKRTTRKTLLACAKYHKDIADDWKSDLADCGDSPDDIVEHARDQERFHRSCTDTLTALAKASK